ncbi:MAG: TetR/AcrR family transcriptional regulator [Chloroflexota bacterium]|nr:TetR/AcrR family transcriptional regulator [Chloroflexota bacterium]MDE2945661.1 TetR/AcrR family transcriptional regulator [Chloroflexota bacterium]
MNQPKKMDRRIARTRRALKSALIELSLEKGYEQISIRDLTHRADIGYATFFRHFRSKDELATYCMHAVITEVFAAIESASTLEEECLAVYERLEKHRDLCFFGLALPRNHPALQPILEEALNWVSTIYMARDEESIPWEVAANHLVNSTVELVRWWLTDGQDYSSEQMALMQNELIIKVTENVALNRRMQTPREAALE